MATVLRKIQGDGPYPVPQESFADFLQIYHSDHLGIVSSKLPINFTPDLGSHYHSNYEFLIPATTMDRVGIERNVLHLEKNHLLPINSNQPHGPKGSMANVHLMAIVISKEYLEEIALSGWQQGMVSFANLATPLEPSLQNLIRNFMEEATLRQPGYRFMLECLTMQISLYLLRSLKNNLPLKKGNADHPSLNHNINKAIEFIRENYNQEFTLGEIAKVVNLSPYHFARVFKAHTGKTPFEYLANVKIEKTQLMLSTTNLSITEICFANGFENLSNFTAVFKKKVGVTPSVYRKIYR